MTRATRIFRSGLSTWSSFLDKASRLDWIVGPDGLTLTFQGFLRLTVSCHVLS